jgi:hypothetical protein
VMLSLVACGGGSAPAAPPATASTEISGDGGQPSATATEAKATGEAPAAEPEEAPPAALPKGKDGSKPSRAPHEVLTQSNTVFMLSFDDSDAKKGAEATCAKEGGKDPKKVAACISRERAKIEADGHGFKKEDEGKFTWSVIQRKGKNVVNLHKMLVTQVSETENTIVLKPEGKDTGTKAGKVPGEFTVDVPSDYRIVITDPKWGKLVYEAKIGLVSQ